MIFLHQFFSVDFYRISRTDHESEIHSRRNNDTKVPTSERSSKWALPTPQIFRGKTTIYRKLPPKIREHNFFVGRKATKFSSFVCSCSASGSGFILRLASTEAARWSPRSTRVFGSMDVIMLRSKWPSAERPETWLRSLRNSLLGIHIDGNKSKLYMKTNKTWNYGRQQPQWGKMEGSHSGSLWQ